MRSLSNKKNIIIKIGSSSLCDFNGHISEEKIRKIVKQVSWLIKRGIKVSIVSSGAIAAGMDALKLKEKPKLLPKKQALAALGQPYLFAIYERIFQEENLYVSQILLNHDDFDDRKRLLNLQYALEETFNYNIIPIFNENDTLAVEEIKVGDNDSLAALLAPVIQADLLILISDIDGLYDSNPHINCNAKLISNVSGVNKAILAMAGDAKSNLGTGGMITKIRAAKMVNDYGCDMVIVNGNTENILIDLISDKDVGTLFDGKPGLRLSGKKHWIRYRSKSKGSIYVDLGAFEALKENRTSLLPKGITDVEGNFGHSQVVEIINQDGLVFARGQVNYSSDQIRSIKGHNTKDIEVILGYKDYDEVIHADNIVIIKEV